MSTTFVSEASSRPAELSREAAPRAIVEQPPPEVGLLGSSLRALDWPLILGRLSRHARTLPGRQGALELPLSVDPTEIGERYLELEELERLANELESPPLGGILDVSAAMARLDKDSVLDLEELRDLAGTVVAVARLLAWLLANQHRAPQLARIGLGVELNRPLVALLDAAFDEVGELSGRTFPELGRLRSRCRELEFQIREKLEDLLRDEGFGGYLQDRYLTEREGRHVLPLKASAPRSIGIVHATSQSGETIFVEPAAVVVRANLLKEAKVDVEREIRRILTDLSIRLRGELPQLRAGIRAAVGVDLACARRELGVELRGVIPEVGDRGVLRVRGFRHPVLALGGGLVVGNDLNIDPRHPGLILSGPNTGGKTIGLKCLGLAALMCRAGIPLPCEEGARVDLFAEVIADIGDQQNVEGGLSTFSGHVRVLVETLARAGRRSLVLLDEAGVGTDPAQGAALARAVLEELVDKDAKVATTTHYAEVKSLAAADERFVLMAAQYADGRPTFRLVPGLSGQSHAFSVAERLRMPTRVVERARELLDQGTRQITELSERLEIAEAEAREAAERVAVKERELLAREKRLAEKEADLLKRRERLETEVGQATRERLKQKEGEVKGLIAALQEKPNLDLAGRSLQRIREIREELKPLPAPPPPPEPSPQPLQVGEKVQVRSMDRRGEVVSILGKDRYEVNVGGLSMRLRREEVLRLDGRGKPIPEVPKASPVPIPSGPAPQVAHADLQALRMDANTLDLRGQRAEEALEACSAFFARMRSSGCDAVFVLHGHGTGVLKKAVRDWLPGCGQARSWRPCYPGEGGDAYTLVGLA